MIECITDITGTKSWWFNGLLHREDGPAIEWNEGGKAWYQNGRLHREDGPAIEYFSGIQEWRIHGTQFTKEEFILSQFTKGIIINE